MATRDNTVERKRANGTPRPEGIRAGRRLPKIVHAPLAVVDLGAETRTLNVGDPSRVLARMNDSGLRFSVFRGVGIWHVHPATDECFLVLRGGLLLDLKDGRTIRVGRHQLVTVPAGLVHRPRAIVRTVALCFKHLVGRTQFLEDDASGRDPRPAIPHRRR
jgi:mannose-6-phosphate isomerase-like protein (cupin superfamily)